MSTYHILTPISVRMTGDVAEENPVPGTISGIEVAKFTFASPSRCRFNFRAPETAVTRSASSSRESS